MTDQESTSKPVMKVRLPSDPNQCSESAHQVHTQAVAAGVYFSSVRPLLEKLFQDDDVAQSAMIFVQGLIERMAPRDPVEEMFAVQIALAHVRTLSLTEKASRAEALDDVRILNEYADRASNSFRRLTQALGDYRRPSRGPTTAIQQANFGAQQLVVNGSIEGVESATNEQGCQDQGQGTNGQADLQPHSSGPGCPQGGGATNAPLGVIDRPSQL
jgi:hypothetical protein